jgi:uncharacterized protein with PhoU and TrkA domain
MTRNSHLIDRAIFAFQQNLGMTPRGKDLVTHNLYVGLLSMARELAHLQHKIDRLSIKVKQALPVLAARRLASSRQRFTIASAARQMSRPGITSAG